MILRRLLFVAFKLWIVLSSASLFAASDKSTSVKDLRYGVALYHYFQGEYFEALSELDVADQRGGIQGHSADPQIIVGGIQLSFGMNRSASELFSSIIDAGSEVDTESIAWYYMARLFYQRGEYLSSREHLDRVNFDDLSKRLKADAAALDVELLFKENRYELADERLAALEDDRSIAKEFEVWRSYLSYNLAAHYVRQENKTAAQPLLDSISDVNLSDNGAIRDEQLVMADRAFTASGYSAFQDENYQQALDYFSQVRQFGDFSDDALLGYGWSAARLENFNLAIATWQSLGSRSLSSEAVQESLLAIPYAYLQLSLPSAAIAGYEDAEKIFEAELAEIDRVGNVILEQPLVELVELENTQANYSWIEPADNYLVQPYVRSLIELFSLTRFQNVIQNIRDLDEIKRRLNAWQVSVSAYDDLMDYRLTQFRAAGTNSNPLVTDSDPFRANALSELTSLRDSLTETIAQAQANRDVYIVLDELQADQLSLIESAENNIAILERAGENVDEETQWVKRYRGALLWSADKDFDTRLWALESDLKKINQSLDAATSGSRAVETLLTEAPDIASAKARIREFNDRIDNTLATTQSLLDRSEEQLRQQIFLVLAEQRQQLQFYLSEARLAIAQIYDNLYLEQQANE